ncbi:MAG: helix-turn-helix transcriptional regulator [Gordonibacter sp.]
MRVKGGMMVEVSMVFAVCGVFAVFVGYGIAVFRAFFVRNADRVAYRLVGVWVVCLAAAIAGVLIADDAFGTEVSAMFVMIFCALSFSLSPLVARRWRNREMAAAVAYLQLHRAAFSGAARPARGEADVGLCPSIDAACASASRAYELTRREEDVLRLLIEGSSMAVVAEKLVVSDNTVKSHVRHIYRKMGVNCKQDLCGKVLGSGNAVT